MTDVRTRTTCRFLAGQARRLALRAVRLPAGLHGDQSGSMSIVSVFSVLLLVFLMGMVMNSGRQVDQKVKMQNAADASTYAGGVVLARSMNTLAFTNHLLCDVFALTAFMREARDQNAASLTPELLDNWERLAPAFEGAEFPRFADLAPAITEKVPHEREMVRTYSEWSAAAAEPILPVLEDILATRAIPQFQRDLLSTAPQLAQFATDSVARRHGENWPRATKLRGVLWRTAVDPVGGVSESQRRTVPAVDPVLDLVPNQDQYVSTARSQRRSYARTYLNQWNSDMLLAFDRVGKMSQFSNLWRIFTCGQLDRLLNDEYPYTNLPFVIRVAQDDIAHVNQHLEQDFMFVGVVYREKLPDRIPGVFRNPLSSDMQAYAQVMVYVPRPRLIKAWRVGGPEPPPSQGEYQGGVPGEGVYLPLPDEPEEPEDPPDDADGDGQPEWYVTRQPSSRYPARWDLVTQNWSTQLVPATAPTIPQILSTPPEINGVTGVETPDLRGLDPLDQLWLSNH